MTEPGISVTTVLNATGLRPAPKPPVPEEIVVHTIKLEGSKSSHHDGNGSGLRASATSSSASHSRAEGGVDKAGATAGVGELSTSSRIGDCDIIGRSTVADSSIVSADPVPVPVPPPVAVPEMIPPANLNCNFLDPLRLRRVMLFLLEDA
jgi:hypothetical protein